jgi:tetratricopeptide (TPR) repeat protein
VQKARWERASRIARGLLVGRESELSLFEELWSKQESGATGTSRLGGSRHIILKVTGEAGIGKSRLAHDFLLGKQNNSLDCTILRGQTMTYAQPPFWLWISLIRDYLGIDLGDSEASEKLMQCIDRIAGQLDDESAEKELRSSTPFLAELLSIPAEHSLDSLDDGMRYRGKIIALRNLVRATGLLSRTVVLLDDLHCIDSASLETLEFIVSNCDTRIPLLFMLLHRPYRDSPPIPDFPDGYAETVALTIPPIPEHSCRLLLGYMLGSTISSFAMEFLLKRSAGNPFFLEELVLDLIESGKMIEKEDTWELAGLPDEIYVPSSLNGLIRSRIDRLPADRKEGLQYCAVLGMEFLMLLYRRLHEKLLHRGDAEGILSELVQKDFLSSVQETTGLKYVFRHILIHDLAYDSLLFHNRRSLHRCVAEAIEELFSDEADSLSPVIAWHWERSGDRGQAIGWGIRALHNCTRTFENEEGLDWAARLTGWLGCRVDDTECIGQQLSVWQDQSRILIVQSRYEKVLELLAGMEELAGSSTDTSEWMLKIRSTRGEALRLLGKPEGARREFELALELATIVGDELRESMILGNLGLVMNDRGEPVRAQKYFDRGLQIARESGNLAEEGCALNYLGNHYYHQGNTDEAIGCFEQALDLAQRACERRSEGIDLSNLGNLFRIKGRMDGAMEHFQSALGIAREVGDRHSEGVILTSISLLHTSSGRSDEALRCNLEALDIARETGIRHFEASVLGSLGSHHHMQGNLDQAMEYFEDALRIHREIGSPEGEGVQLRYIGLLLIDLDRIGEADDYCRRALEIHRDTDNQRDIGRDFAGMGRISWKNGRIPEAGEFFLQALEISEKVGDRVAEGTTLAMMADMCLEQREKKLAVDYYSRAISIIEDLSMAELQFTDVYGLCRRLLEAGASDEDVPLPSNWNVGEE